ncbi:cactin-like [Chenopodium quinoa]|uniref:cactin-like n=1 Tax=Chenopodium quinoa TaxID=63459 RepID=UPI000B790F91|nr:cactin-like [Chenopodium quinoa]
MLSHESSRSSRRRGRWQFKDNSDYDMSESFEEAGYSRKRKRNISEEEVKEYLAKKAQRKAVSVAKKFKNQITNEQFVWKKIERDVMVRGFKATMDDLTVKAEKKRQKELMAEFKKMQKRREERVEEKARRDEELMMLQRERDRAESGNLEMKEREFLLEQYKIRSRVRLREGRAKPIDILIVYLDESDKFDVKELYEPPYMVFKGSSTVKEFQELIDDIKLHLDLDRAPMSSTHAEYWEALMVVCEWELAEIRKKEEIDHRVRLHGMHTSVEKDVINYLEGKSYKDLVALLEQIESLMLTGRAKVVEYWEAVLKQLHFYKAKACLDEIHMSRNLHHLEVQQALQEENTKSVEGTEEEVEDARDGPYSPRLLHGEDNEEAIDPDEDRAVLEKRLGVLVEQKRWLKEAGMALEPRSKPEEGDFEVMAKKESMGAMEEGDVVLGSDAVVNLDSQVYDWHDMYRPRKPKYFNYFHTSYEWNKYNRTHYSRDNPPPKFVQGYKFNVFYPHLIDSSKVPKALVEKDGDSTETCILRFQAGPPYEDLAFRIVLKEWELSCKKGFKCTFEQGILRLYFNFKRYGYRR